MRQVIKIRNNHLRQTLICFRPTTSFSTVLFTSITFSKPKSLAWISFKYNLAQKQDIKNFIIILIHYAQFTKLCQHKENIGVQSTSF